MSLYSIYTKMPESIRKFFRKSHLADCWRARIQRKCHKNAVKKVNWNVPVFYDEGILCRYINREKYHSQFSQDFFLDRIVFNGKKSGFFIDIGANHPEQLSNTLYFEDLGWHGMAFEPQAGLCALWKDRKTECHNLALGDREGELEFAEYEGDDGFGVLAGAASVLGKAAGKKYMVKQRRLGDVLKEAGVKTVDFISLDVEGYEMNVLLGIDFTEVDILCFLIENNKGKDGMSNMQIRKFMDENGYDFIGRIVIDDVFVKRTA